MLIDEITAILDGDADKAKAVCEHLALRIRAEAKRIRTENAPALKGYGLHDEARARTLAALFVEEWASIFDREFALQRTNEQLANTQELIRSLREKYEL